MSSISATLAAAHQRGLAKALAYQGALLPREAYEIRQTTPTAYIVDVRTQAEFNYVGRIPKSVEIEWQTYPGGVPNASFLVQLQTQVDKDAVVMFICRSGVRSHAAAQAATAAGYRNVYNVLEGFQGDADANGHRDSIGGWRVAGLPWYQS
ncbi:MAG: rhodanese-like domain-containing protein [Betaproteobacteria bacterium]